MKGDHNNRKGSKCDVLMTLFLLFFSYFDWQVICRQRKRNRGTRKETWSQAASASHEIFITTWTGQFQCCFAWKSFEGKKKGKENTQITEVTMQKARSMTHLDQYLTNNGQSFWIYKPYCSRLLQWLQTHLDISQRTYKVFYHQEPLSQSQTGESLKRCVSRSPTPPLQKLTYLNHVMSGSFIQVFSSDPMNSSLVARVEWIKI